MFCVLSRSSEYLKEINMNILMVVPIMGYKDRQPKFSTFIKTEIDALRSSGVQVFPTFLVKRNHPMIVWRFALSVRRMVKEHNVDLIHIQTGTAAFFTRVKNPGVPVLVTLGGSELLGYPGKGWIWWFRGQLAKMITKAGLKMADRIVCVSQNIQEQLGNSFKEKSDIIPRGVNTELFDLRDKAEARRLLGWSVDEKYILFSNPRLLAEVKNLPLAKKTIEKLNEQSKSKVNLEIINNKTPEEVVWMLNAADALLVTSFHEGSPNIVKEAMACDLPVVSVPCGDVQDRLKTVMLSFVSVYDEVLLADALRKVISEGTRSDGREKLFTQGLSRDQYVMRITDLYNKMINNDQHRRLRKRT